MRARKPCVRACLRLPGWKVRFMTFAQKGRVKRGNDTGAAPIRSIAICWRPFRGRRRLPGSASFTCTGSKE
jgi:hypothetical protein